MKRRWQLSLGLLLVLSICCCGAWLLLRPPSPVNMENFLKIERGMARANVEALLGLPCGGDEEYKPVLEPVINDLIKGVTKRQMSTHNYRYNNSSAPAIKSLFWLQGETLILVQFSDEDRVAGKEFSTIPRPTFTERFRYWLGF